MKKVLVLCNDFPPLNSIGAQRPYSWYKFLPDSGIHVTVITKNWEAKSALPNHIQTAGEKSIEEDTCRTLIRVSDAQAPAAWIVEKFGTERMVLLRKFMVFLEQFFKWVWGSWDKNRNIYKEAKRLLAKEQFDVVITTGEPFILFKYGSLLRRKFNFKWIADYRDGWFHNHVSSTTQNPLKKLIRQWEKWHEEHLLRYTDLITGPDEILAKILGEFHQKPYQVVYNGFWSFFQPPLSFQPVNDTALVLTHAGTLTPGQQAEFLLDAVLDLHNEGYIKPGDLVLSFLGIDYFPNQKRRLASHPLPAAYKQTSPRLPQEESRLRCYESDYLLSFTESDYKAIYAKTYDYLSVGRPILVIPDDESILGKLVLDCEAGFVFQSENELKEFILDAVQRKRGHKGTHTVTVNTTKAAFYLRSKQTERLANIIKEL